mmetsp:Transcript_10037/g.14910  ORF Transcript_10037/g.14910 Transcript_10037/m.14910 type:complete len:166 (-) Transcript_10037:54-551(-)
MTLSLVIMSMKLSKVFSLKSLFVLTPLMDNWKKQPSLLHVQIVEFQSLLVAEQLVEWIPQRLHTMISQKRKNVAFCSDAVKISDRNMGSNVGHQRVIGNQKSSTLLQFFSTEVQKSVVQQDTSSLRRCDGALGTSCFVTGTYGFVAASRIVEMIAKDEVLIPKPY